MIFLYYLSWAFHFLISVPLSEKNFIKCFSAGVGSELSITIKWPTFCLFVGITIHLFTQKYNTLKFFSQCDNWRHFVWFIGLYWLLWNKFLLVVSWIFFVIFSSLVIDLMTSWRERLLWRLIVDTFFRIIEALWWLIHFLDDTNCHYMFPWYEILSWNHPPCSKNSRHVFSLIPM